MTIERAIESAVNEYARPVHRASGKVTHYKPYIYSGLCEKCGGIFFSTKDIARFCGYSCACETRTKGLRNKLATGWHSGRWKGGRFIHQGYIRLFSPDHPRVAHRNRSHKYVYEHILVMEKSLGRFLLPGENVHHKNGNRADNRIENLELWVSAQPKGQRPQDLVAHAIEIARRYPDEFKKQTGEWNGSI